MKIERWKLNLVTLILLIGAYSSAAQAQSHVTGAHQFFLDLKVQAGADYCFEEGELAIPPQFSEQTLEERNAGF